MTCSHGVRCCGHCECSSHSLKECRCISDTALHVAAVDGGLGMDRAVLVQPTRWHDLCAAGAGDEESVRRRLDPRHPIRCATSDKRVLPGEWHVLCREQREGNRLGHTFHHNGGGVGAMRLTGDLGAKVGDAEGGEERTLRLVAPDVGAIRLKPTLEHTDYVSEDSELVRHVIPLARRRHRSA